MTNTDDRLQFLLNALEQHSGLADRIRQTLLMELHSRGLVSMDTIYREARSRTRHTESDEQTPEGDNVQVARRWDQDDKRNIQDVTVEVAARHFGMDELEDLVNLTRKRHEAEGLEEIATLGSVSMGVLNARLRQFCALPVGQTRLDPEESQAVRIALVGRYISEQLPFQKVAKRYLGIRDFGALVERIVAPSGGSGLIGGKAAGLLLGTKILEREGTAIPGWGKIPVRTPDSWFLRSDVTNLFLRLNGLQHLRDHKFRGLDEVRNDYPMLLELFKNSTFPPEIADRLRRVLEKAGTHPLIVRSSSLLEDRFGTAFAGKYRSVFVSNQGSIQERLDELLGAIAEVYASSLHPDPISYRRRHDLVDFDEQMAVLIQKIVGRRVGRYFLPIWAGVGMSHNPIRRNPRIRPEDGMVRVVFGLGTRAVDRVDLEAPRQIPLGLPGVRPEVLARDIVGAAQKKVDVIDLERRTFASVPVGRVLEEGGRLPALGTVMSLFQHGAIRPMVGDGMLADPSEMVVTFNGFATASPYPAFLKGVLDVLRTAYGCPVDIEFAFDGESFHLLQCRPQAVRPRGPRAAIPSDIPPERRIFAAHRDVMGGSVEGIRYMVLIDPRDYNAITTEQRRLEIGRVVSAVNRRLAQEPFALMGPGRWGSRDLRMGVRVGYSDIDNARLLVEIARQHGGYTPEVSFGSHFFQDLVESDIQYLALYPDEPGALFDEAFLHGTPNSLAELLPIAADYEDVVRIVDVPAVTGGRTLSVVVDEESQQALGFLA